MKNIPKGVSESIQIVISECAAGLVVEDGLLDVPCHSSRWGGRSRLCGLQSQTVRIWQSGTVAPYINA